MKSKESPLKLRSFYIVESSMQTVSPRQSAGQDELDVSDEQIPYVPGIDLNFDILDNSTNPEEFAIKLNIKTKRTAYHLPGYKFKITIVGEFYLQDRENLKPKKHTQYVFFSALPMVISLARAEIANLTAKGVFGIYYLPSIDLPAVIDKWFEEHNKNSGR